MTVVDSAAIRDKKVISQDASIVGDVQDIRYNPASWNIEGLKVRCSKNVASRISAGTGKAMIMLGPVQFNMDDVILLPDDVEGANGYIRADSDSYSLLSYIVGRKVITSDGVAAGTVETVMVDMDSWTMNSLKLKLDKTACERLGVKKGLLFSKIVSGVPVNVISAVSENIMLGITADELKDIIVLD